MQQIRNKFTIDEITYSITFRRRKAKMEDNEPINLYDQLESWANQENRDLHAEIQKDSSELQGVKAECQELNERVNILREHLKNVQAEVTKTQELLTAKNSQVEEEKHLTQLVLREKGRIASEIAKIEEKRNDIRAKWENVQSKTFQSEKRMQTFRDEYKLNQQELEQWITIARQKEEDFIVLQRYQTKDESKIREMLLEIEKSTGIVEAKRLELEQEVTATRALQIQLDMTAEQFRQLHDDRTQLLSQWEATMKQLNNLHSRIGMNNQSIKEREVEVDRLHQEVAEEKKNLDAAQTENQSIERQLTIGDHKVSQQHKQYEKDSTELAEFIKTVETQRHQLEKLESDEAFYRGEIQDFKDKTAQEIAKREEYLKRLKLTEQALATQSDATKDFNQQSEILTSYLKEQTVNLKKIDAEIAAGKDSIFKLSQDVSEVKKKQKDLLAEMEGSQTRAKNLQLKIQEFDRETQKQMELLYNSNFQIQQMERKIARIEGERTEEEKMELQAQIEQLTDTLTKKQEIEKTLSLQLHRLELDLRQTARKKESLKESNQQLEVKLNEIRLDQDSLDKSTVKSRSQKEEVLVQLNMLRLQVEKLTEQVNMKSDELISLENRRQQLQLSMEERVLEIDAHIAALRTQLKTEEEARHLAGIELKERQKRAETLEAKYQVMMGKYQVEGEEVSQSYHVIKFAKEREEVSRRGDELDALIRKKTKELQQLEKAMNKLNAHNTDFRKAFTSVTESDNDMERKKVLEEQVRVAQQRLNARRAQANSIAQEKKEREKTSQEQEAVIEKMKNNIMKLKPSLDRAVADNTELKEKIKRVQKVIQKAREKHRTELNVPTTAKYPETLLEMDIELRMEKANVELVLVELNRLAESNSEVLSKLRLGLTQMGIPLNSLPALQSNNEVPSIIPKGARIIKPDTGSGSRTPSSNGSRLSSYRSSGTPSVRSGAGSALSSAGSHRSVGSLKQVKLG